MCDLPVNNTIEEGKKTSVEEDFIDIFKNMDGCSDVDEEDIDNDGGYKAITEEEIIASCSVTELSLIHI